MMSLMNFNKGAMFGLEARALKKQSSELFLARLRRLSFRLVEGQQASGNKFGITLKQLSYKAKFGAMFGLDARIALTIFSAVALISTASFYHIVENSNVNKLIYEIKEIKNAVSAYQIDTDSDLPIIATGIYNISELKSSTKDGWRQPYLDYKKASGVDSNKYLVNSTFGRFSLFEANNRSASSITETPFNSCSNGAKLCYLWVLFDSSSYGEIPASYINILDEKVDGADGALSGRVQKYNSNGLLYRLDLIG